MPISARRCGYASALFLAFMAVYSAAASAAPVSVHTIRTDLKPLIRTASESPVQFAVLVPHAVSSTSGGSWSSAGAQATWRYAVQVPSAVSLSFHAVKVLLPESATLVVRGARTTTSYRARDLHQGELWSRIQPGAALEFTLTVDAAQRARVVFSIASLQAGYRSLGAGVPDHPYYRQLRQAAAGVDSTSCVTNYQCRATAANTPAGSATVALIVGGVYQCTGTLINDVPQDNTPYLLSARHCLSGKVGVPDDPTRAASLQVYWDAATGCGATLGAIYDPGTPTQTGAQTVVEQQDAWLVRLDANPVVADAQFAGFDASGAAIEGGYTIHHAEGFNRQFAAWFGQALPVQRFSGFADFLETVNQTGNIGPGASGGALFDQNNHLVGSLTYGRDSSDPSGYGACPATNLTAPDGNNGAADFTALNAVWNSTADATSGTGSATLRAVLDPNNTGTVLVPGAPAALVSLSASATTLVFGDPLQLTWSASNATQCAASGGAPGDGWTGALASSGSLSLTATAPGRLTYTVNCQYAGGRVASASASVAWLGPAPQLQFAAPAHVWTTRPATLSWTSNVGPCSVTGGGLTLANLAPSGSTTTTQATSADVLYLLTCGTANDSGSAQAAVSYVTPALSFEANGTDRRLGESFLLQWLSYADSCLPSGGATNDGWSSNLFNGGATQFAPEVTLAGTYTYTLTCSSGALSVQASVSVTFESNAAYVTAALSQASLPFSASPADYVSLSWNSNLSRCSINNTAAPISYTYDDALNAYGNPQGAITLSPAHSGTYTLSVICTGSAAALTSTPLTLTVTPPPPPTATIAFHPAQVVAGQTFTVSWTTNNASGCTQLGGIPHGAWAQNPYPQGPAGSETETALAGDFMFGLSCQSIDPALQPVTREARLGIVALADTLTTSAADVTRGDSFTLTWTSSGASGCASAGGGADGRPWSGPLPTSGSATQTATASGTFTYELDCGVDNLAAVQRVSIRVSAASDAGSRSAATGGGLGALAAPELAVLAALLACRRRLRSPHGGSRHAA